MIVLSPFAVVCLASLFILHFVVDFMCQTDWMALNKSKWYEAFGSPGDNTGLRGLLSHTGLYGLAFLMFGWQFALITFVAHTLTDALTSQLTSKLWLIEFAARPDMEDIGGGYMGWKRYGAYELLAIVHASKRHWFFVAIGFDQLLHQLQLVLTFWFLFAR